MVRDSTGLDGKTRNRQAALVQELIQGLVDFSNIVPQVCAYSIESPWQLLDEKMSITRVWRLPEVMTQTGLSRSSIYEMISRDEFPRQINLGPRAVGWVAEEILAWIDSKIREARSHGSRS